MKVYGKKTVTIDCEWEIEDQPGLKKKLESMENYELIEICVEGFERDYELLDSIAYKGIALERAYFESGEEVDGCVKIFTADGNIINIE